MTPMVKGLTENRHRAKMRSGTVYIIAMGTSLIVACLAVASLQAIRVQRKINESVLQISNANNLAEAGIEFVQQRMASNANWRSEFTNGVPVTRTVPGGTFSVTLTDPEDGSIANRTTDPIEVVSTGVFGSAQKKLAVYFEPQSQLLAASRASLYAENEISIEGGTITANQWAYCEKKIETKSGATVNMNCLAQNQVDGTGYNQRKIVGGIWPMDKPELQTTSSNYVGKYYIDNSLAINVSDLPTGGSELVSNSGFEVDTSGWSSFNCTIARNISQKRSGAASCLVTAQGFLSTPIFNITPHMIKGRGYNISFWIRTIEDQDIYPVLSLTGTGSAWPVIKTGSAVPAIANTWTLVSTTLEATWSGKLSKAEFQIASEKNSNFHFDDVSIIDAEREVGVRYIENTLLSATNNPYGGKSPSPSGIYSINAPGEKILIRNCRMNATLVITDGKEVEVRGAVSWEPHGRNFPAVITDESIYDLTSISSLRESDIGVNLNPASTPYLGNSDTDTSDEYSCTINGAVVSDKDITLDGRAIFTGPIMSSKKINVNANDLTINFPSDMIMNPPPGFFSSPPTMRLLPSSRRSVP